MDIFEQIEHDADIFFKQADDFIARMRAYATLCKNCSHRESEHMDTGDRICMNPCECRGFERKEGKK